MFGNSVLKVNHFTFTCDVCWFPPELVFTDQVSNEQTTQNCKLLGSRHFSSKLFTWVETQICDGNTGIRICEIVFTAHFTTAELPAEDGHMKYRHRQEAATFPQAVK